MLLPCKQKHMANISNNRISPEQNEAMSRLFAKKYKNSK